MTQLSQIFEEVIYATVTAINDESDKVGVSQLVYCIGYVSNKFQTKTDWFNSIMNKQINLTPENKKL